MNTQVKSKLSLVEILVIAGVAGAVVGITNPVRVDAKVGNKIAEAKRLDLANAVYNGDNDSDAGLVSSDTVGRVIMPTRQVQAVRDGINVYFDRGFHALGGGKGGRGNGITYHGGPVMTATTTNVYYIWYGNWSGNSATTILTDFANNIGGSPYYNINTTYYDGSNVKVKNSVTYAGSTTDSYSQGTSLSDSAVQSVVSSAISSGRLPKDTNGVYFVLTSADVTASSGFCTSYCGWHTYGTISGSNIKYSFVGDPTRCPSACAAQTTGPNGSSGADGMASIIAHELEEAVSDPNLNAWYDTRGAENADKCAWTFGTTSTAANGAKYNMTLGARNFLIQQNWVNASGGFCAKSY